MENVHRIVRERLKAAAPVVGHPDADILTAFAERSLAEVERAGVLDHLARCSDCREVVALALPQTEPVAASLPSSPSRLLAWPTLRWGFAAAGLIVIISLGVLQYQRHRPESTIAAKTQHVAVTEARNETLPTVPSLQPSKERDKFQATENSVSASASARNQRTLDLKSTSRLETAKTVPQASPGGGSGYGQGSLSHGPRMLNQMQQSASALQAPAAPPSQYANEVPAQVTNAPAPSSPQVSAEAQSPAVQPAYDYADAKVEKTKPVETTGSSASQAEAFAVAPVAGRTVTASTASNAAWRITADGGLERSLDRGNTWQDIEVRTNGSATAGGSFRVATQTAIARAKKAAPSAINENAPPVFRAVAANGADVWAGGSAALLCHSSDAGNHWTRVMPSSEGATLTGDVLSVNFPDTQHGSVSTATSVWTTSDGGQTWQQQ